jgi:hypothetical protein
LLNSFAGAKLDPDCIAALEQSRAEMEEIQRQFREDPIG